MQCSTSWAPQAVKGWLGQRLQLLGSLGLMLVALSGWTSPYEMCIFGKLNFHTFKVHKLGFRHIIVTDIRLLSAY